MLTTYNCRLFGYAGPGEPKYVPAGVAPLPHSVFEEIDSREYGDEMERVVAALGGRSNAIVRDRINELCRSTRMQPWRGREATKFLDDYAAVKGKPNEIILLPMTGCLACLPPETDPFLWSSGWLSPPEVRGLQIRSL